MVYLARASTRPSAFPKTEKNPEKPNVALSPDRLRAAEADQLHLLDIYLGSEADFSAIFSGSLMPEPKSPKLGSGFGYGDPRYLTKSDLRK